MHTLGAYQHQHFIYPTIMRLAAIVRSEGTQLISNTDIIYIYLIIYIYIFFFLNEETRKKRVSVKAFNPSRTVDRKHFF